MGTETRIGIVAGLLIVVIASVYFYYGQNRLDQDLLVTANPAVSPPPKIPNGAVTPNGGAAIRQQQPIASAPPPKQVVPVPPTMRQPTPAPVKPLELTRAPEPAKPQVTIAANPPQRPTTPPVFPQVVKTAPKPKPPVDINADPAETIDEKDDLAEATWDHLAKSRTEVNKKASPAIPNNTAAGSPLTTPRPNLDNRMVSAPPPTMPIRLPPPVEQKSTISAKPDQSWPRSHTVTRGDTLSGISFQYYADHVHVQQIVTANPQLKNPHALKIGDVLSIPQPLARPAEAKTSPSILAAADTGNPPYVSLVSRMPEDKANPAGSGKPIILPDKTPTRPVPIGPALLDRTHTVQGGDTLYSLAKKYYGDGKKWQRIFDANRALLKGDSKNLRKGMALRIPR